MVFSLLFAAAVIITLLVLYNQGQLLRNRVQVTNAADAAVYSVAKLGARQLNMTAYINRAMVANEVSIGQMMAFVSWAQRYENMPQFINAFPPYHLPIAPPFVPVTYATALNALFAPFRVLGTIAGRPARVVARTWPSGVAGFNTILGGMEAIFAGATVMAQREASIAIVQAHQLGHQGGLEQPEPLGAFFLAQATAQNYFGDALRTGPLLSALSRGQPALSPQEAKRAHQYLVDNQAVIGQGLLQLNRPGGRTAERRAEYQRFGAFVNDSRDGWTRSRVNDSLWFAFGFNPPEFTIPLWPLPPTWVNVDLDVDFGAGARSAGGSAYRYQTRNNVDHYGWSSIDVTSLVLMFNVDVDLEICVDLFFTTECSGTNLSFGSSWGTPIGGATYQLVNRRGAPLRFMPDWGQLGVPGDKYGNVFNGEHTATHLVGQALQMYGTRANDRDDTYSKPPPFISLTPEMRRVDHSQPFALAVIQRSQDIPTTDNPSAPLGGGGAIGSGLRDFTDFSLQTGNVRDSVVPYANATLPSLLGDAGLLEVASAELYFKRRGTQEKANLFSPFWDSRLTENSPITLMLARGLQSPAGLIDGFTNNVDIWLQDQVSQQTREVGAAISSNVPAPFDRAAQNVYQSISNYIP